MASPNDERLRAVRRQAEELLAKLQLTPEEEGFAREHARLIHDEITAAYLSLNDEAFGRTRALSAAAAVALALVTIGDWANKTDTDFPRDPT